MAKIAAPPETSIEVRSPASLPANSLSTPIRQPRVRAMTRLMSICSKVSIYVNFNVSSLCRQARFRG